MDLNNIQCPICGSKNLTPKNSFCIFMKKKIYRFKCADCDLIFGPIEYINLTKNQLADKYKELYKSYAENDSTEYEVKTFLSLFPEKGGSYLNYGSGKWSKSKEIINSMGYTIDCFDFSFNDVDTLLSKKYDGIISNNLIEHLQHPVEDFLLFRDLLKEGKMMAHSTPCYEYRYDYSIFHLYFFIGRSLELLAKKTGFELEHYIQDGEYILKRFIKTD